MFKRQAITDERIINMQNKIYRELYWVVVFVCAVSLVTKTAIGHSGFADFAVELAILIGCGSYYLFRSARLGLYSEEVELANRNSKMNADKKITLQSVVIGVGAGIVLGVFFGLNSALNYAEGTSEAITYFFLVFFTTIMMYAPVLFVLLFVPHIVAKAKSDKVNARMLEQEDDDV